MPDWNYILGELNCKDSKGNLLTNVDQLRQKYLRRFSRVTKRNVIAYYSAFLNRVSERTSIDDNDMNGFMNAVHKLDKSRGLDLILHTPGGTISSACAIVTYLKSIFNNNIRCFVPQMAMSAGTMISCSCSEIFMGKHSSIGPIDPQFGAMSTGDVIEEALMAKNEMATSPCTAPYWATLLAKYPPAFIGKCEKAVEFAADNVERWLSENMFAQETDSVAVAKSVVQALSDHSLTKQHDRHISSDEARAIGLKVTSLESDRKLQDALLSIHHAYMITFSRNAKVAKIIENYKGKTMVVFH